MKIIDAQVHLWSSGTPSGHHRQASSFTAEELLQEMDAAGVDAALIHPPASWDPDSNAQAVAAAKKYPGRFAVMGQFALDNPENRKLIRGWRNQSGMMGLRYPLVLPEQQDWHKDGTMDWLWPAVE